MNIKSLFIAAFMFATFGISTVFAEGFIAIAPSGQPLCFSVLTESTVEFNGHADKDALSGSLIIPSTVSYNYKTYTVTRINSSFSGYSNPTSVTIPNSVTSIASAAFRNFTGLTSINIPNTITSIEKYTFLDCSSLMSINIPNSVTSIGDGTFWNCISMTSATIPNSVTTIGVSAFSGCSSLRSVTIPNSVTTIGEVLSMAVAV